MIKPNRLFKFGGVAGKRFFSWIWHPRMLLWLVAGGLVVSLFAQISFRELLAVLQQLQVGEVFLLLLVNIAIVLLFSGRWWLILRVIGYSVSYPILSLYRLAGFSVSYLTPGPQFGGEPVLVFLLNRLQSVPIKSATSSVLLDKLLELLANFSFLAVGLYTALNAGLVGNIVQAHWLLIAILGAPLVYLIALGRGYFIFSILLGSLVRLKWMRRLSIIAGWIAEAEHEAGEIIQKNPGVIFQSYWVSMLVWVLMLGEYWLTLHFLGLSLDYTETIVVLSFVRLAFLSPVPGGLGLVEAGQIYALQLFGYPAAAGLGVALIIRARDSLLAGSGLWVLGFFMKSRKGPSAVVSNLTN